MWGSVKWRVALSDRRELATGIVRGVLPGSVRAAAVLLALIGCNAPPEQLFVSAVTIGEIQAGIEITREQDEAKPEELEVWLDKVLAPYGVLAVDAPAFREWARLMHRRSDMHLDLPAVLNPNLTRVITLAFHQMNQ